MTEERQLIPARAYRGEARQSGFLARRDQSISRTFDKPPFRFSNKALLLPRVQKVGRERKKDSALLRSSGQFPSSLSLLHPSERRPDFNFHSPRRRERPTRTTPLFRNTRKLSFGSIYIVEENVVVQVNEGRKETSRKFQSLGDGFASHPMGDMEGGGDSKADIRPNIITPRSFLLFLFSFHFGRGNSGRN